MSKNRELIAILRGLTLDRCVKVSEILIAEGFSKLEVPLNSPNPMETISKMQNSFGNSVTIGAGTVTNVSEVSQLSKIGCQMIVSPNTDTEVIKATKNGGMLSFPGAFTPSECYSAINSAADGLKIFPAFKLGVKGFKALKAVLPNNLKTYAVGGIDETHFSDWLDAGVTGFGIGSNLFHSYMSDDDIQSAAKKFVLAYDNWHTNKK
ncbi:MAG: 2-dehydro-3-deoxy-6-phosphogalactonate aldolase [Paracoccaceae bacterium]|jgi:2-dehydro-3-deoxyphosphogalactonate aldolase|nr:2-dehydro-3-deoxy-6-phosphogalactonate aldolase [Paracoccaceae bacterium]|tara:strand:- start:750 stop:1370 length:621 start_codon:yes stop_codon:yes gene_type:complete